ncbi:unnamed protein product [Larinioides sclopetarius]|uniref:Uncharacterized protein n=1 Tax=Larinioides sclopetarius TaxID=280406 RepID=A0AAV2BIW1_9ARAC
MGMRRDIIAWSSLVGTSLEFKLAAGRDECHPSREKGELKIM